jgi:hypothetical protein
VMVLAAHREGQAPTVAIGSVVSRIHSTGSSSGGGFTSRTRTTLTSTEGNARSPLAGGRSVTAAARTSTVARRLSRAVRPSRRRLL